MEFLLQPSLRWKGTTMRKTLLALAAAATFAVSAASPAYAGPRTYPGPGGYPYWSGYVDAPVGQPIPPATGEPSASGMVMPGACAECASAADQVAAVSVPRPCPKSRTCISCSMISAATASTHNKNAFTNRPRAPTWSTAMRIASVIMSRRKLRF